MRALAALAALAAGLLLGACAPPAADEGRRKVDPGPLPEVAYTPYAAGTTLTAANLAELDDDHNGRLTRADRLFSHLGRREGDAVRTLTELGLAAVDLDETDGIARNASPPRGVVVAKPYIIANVVPEGESESQDGAPDRP